MRWIVCPGTRDKQDPPLRPKYSRWQDDAVKPKAKCLDCGAIMAINKDGSLHKHRAPAKEGEGDEV